MHIFGVFLPRHRVESVQTDLRASPPAPRDDDLLVTVGADQRLRLRLASASSGLWRIVSGKKSKNSFKNKSKPLDKM